MRRRFRLSVVTSLLTLIGSMTVGDASDAVDPSAFRVTWQRRAYSVAGGFEGRVENNSPFRVNAVRLRIEGVDEGGNAVGETSTWVFGSVPARGQGHFVFRAIPGAVTYRVTVAGFDRVAREDLQSP